MSDWLTSTRWWGWCNVRGAWGCFGVSRGVFGVLEGVSVLWEVSGSDFYSIPINLNGALIKALTFSRRPGGSRYQKYQNVPKSRWFWAIGRPRERFQSRDIRVYFISVPMDHTVEATSLHWGGKYLWKQLGLHFLACRLYCKQMGEKGIMHGVHAAERQGWIQSPKCMHNWVPISNILGLFLFDTFIKKEQAYLQRSHR